MLAEKIYKALYQPLFNSKADLPSLSTKEFMVFMNLVTEYMMNGFMLSHLNFVNDIHQIEKKLQDNCKKISMRTMLVLTDLKHISSILNQSNIKNVVMKGAALELSNVYDGGIRHYRDVDILICKKDVFGVANLPHKK